MIKIVFIGNSTPLHKALRMLNSFRGISVQAVIFDLKNDQETLRICKTNNFSFFSIDDLRNKNSSIFRKELRCHYIFSINSTMILSKDILEMASEGALNLHPGILPEYAGMHTHQWAIRNGENRFGVTLHWMNSNIDQGNVVYQSIFSIKEKETGLSLYLKCQMEGIKLIQKAFNDIINGICLPSIPQKLSNRKFYTDKMAQNGKINWREDSQKVLRFIRAADYGPFTSPSYKPFSKVNGILIIISEAEIATDILPPGKIKVSEMGEILVGTGNGSIRIIGLLDEHNEKLNLERFSMLVKSSRYFTV